MIYGDLTKIDKYNYLCEGIKKALSHALETELSNLEDGTHEIDGKELFLNKISVSTKLEEERFWEAHREYLDIHIVVKGSERIGLNFIDNLTYKEYIKKDDFVSLDGEIGNSIVLKPNEFLICFPEDGHMTLLQESDISEKITKVIYKVKI